MQKSLKATLAALLLGASLAATAASNDGQQRVNDLLSSDAQYRSSWQSAIKPEQRLADWVINLSGNGSPMTGLEAGHEKYLVGQLCETDDCSKQRLYVAFGWDKSNAYGLLVQIPVGLPEDKSPSRHADLHWIGKPDDQVKALLEEQLKKDPGWY